jgi:hypothetical protein
MRLIVGQKRHRCRYRRQERSSRGHGRWTMMVKLKQNKDSIGRTQIVSKNRNTTTESGIWIFLQHCRLISKPLEAPFSNASQSQHTQKYFEMHQNI